MPILLAAPAVTRLRKTEPAAGRHLAVGPGGLSRAGALLVDGAVLGAEADLVAVLREEGTAVEAVFADVSVTLRSGADEADARAGHAKTAVHAAIRGRVALEAERVHHPREAEEVFATARQARRLVAAE